MPFHFIYCFVIVAAPFTPVLTMPFHSEEESYILFQTAFFLFFGFLGQRLQAKFFAFPAMILRKLR